MALLICCSAVSTARRCGSVRFRPGTTSMSAAAASGSCRFQAGSTRNATEVFMGSVKLAEPTDFTEAVHPMPKREQGYRQSIRVPRNASWFAPGGASRAGSSERDSSHKWAFGRRFAPVQAAAA